MKNLRRRMERTPIVPGLLDLSFQQEHKKPAKDAKKRYYNQLEEIFAKHRRIRTKGQIPEVKVQLFPPLGDFVCLK